MLFVAPRAAVSPGAADLVTVWPLHRFDLVGPTLAALQDEGITAHLRGAQLLHFFAPYLPVEILVPRTDADRAAVIVAATTTKALMAV